ncbi:MAG: acyl-CoA reductase, partial [Longimicrobiales bacterium]
MTIRFDAFHLPDLDDADLDGWTDLDVEGVTFRHPRLSPGAIERMAGRLRDARIAVLRDRPVGDVVAAIDRATALLEDDAELRAAIAVALPAASGLSAPGARCVFERMRMDWSRESLERVLRLEFGGADPLDRFVPDTHPDPSRGDGPRRYVRA